MGSRVRDLRHVAINELDYPRNAVVVICGVPGAGKTTLLRRISRTPCDESLSASSGGVTFCDAEQVRARWRSAPLLRHIPYALWRPLAHARHYVRVTAAFADGKPLVLADCCTRPWVRVMLTVLARVNRRELHVVAVDVDPERAREGQRERGRVLSAATFRTHVRRWRRLIATLQRTDDPGRVVPGARSATIVGSDAVHQLRAIRFLDGTGTSSLLSAGDQTHHRKR